MEGTVKNFGIKTFHVVTGIALFAVSISLGMLGHDGIVALMNRAKTTEPSKTTPSA